MPDLQLFLAPTLFILWTVANLMVTIIAVALTIYRRKVRDQLTHSQGELARSLSLMRAALESTSTAVLVMDMNQNIITYNQKFIDLWSLPAGWEHIPGSDERFRFLSSKVKDPDGFYQRVRKLWGIVDQVGYDLIEFKDGRIIERFAMPYRMNGEISGRLYSYIDISERKQTEAKIQELLNLEQERVRRLEGLRTASANVTIEISLVGLLKSIVRNAASLMDAAACELSLTKPEIREVFLAPDTLAPTFSQETGMLEPELKERVIRSRRAVLVDSNATGQGKHSRSLMAVPLMDRREVSGVLTLTETQRGRPFNGDDLQLVELFAQQASIAIQNALLFEEVNRMAVTDMLTGLYNRRQLMTLAQQELERTFRYASPLTVILFDIDHFKQVNDHYGHLVGDQVLRWLAKNCLGHLRINDILGRYGGEEFLVLLPSTSLLEGIEAAEHLRELVANEPYQDKRCCLNITVSVGVVSWNPQMHTLEDLLEHVDQALYQSKKTGRNQVTGMDDAHRWIYPQALSSIPLPRPFYADEL